MNYSSKISIITVNLNNLLGLKLTLNSVLSQTFSGYEIIIIDGDSKDGSLEFIKENTAKITYWISEPDSGIYNAMNKGIIKANGEYCLFLNSGDWFVDDNVLNCFYENKFTSDLVVGSCNVLFDNKIIHTFFPNADLTLLSFHETTIPHQSTFIRRALFDKIGCYSEEYKIHGDYDFWIRSIVIWNCSYDKLFSVVANYDMNGISSDPMVYEASKKEVRQIQLKYLPERVLADYENWKQKEKQYFLWDWVKNNNILFYSIKVIYRLAVFLIYTKKTLLRLRTEL